MNKVDQKCKKNLKKKDSPSSEPNNLFFIVFELRESNLVIQKNVFIYYYY